MDIRDLMPWSWGRRSVCGRHEEDDPFRALQRNAYRVFDDFVSDFSSEPLGRRFTGFSPRVDVTESDKEIKVSAELPGLDEKDIDISVTKKAVIIKGEKKEKTEEKTEGYYKSERTYGSFQRTVPLDCEIDTDKVEASFKKGVLTITLPKTPEAVQETKKIAVKSE
jgi:HSP20 family protein